MQEVSCGKITGRVSRGYPSPLCACEIMLAKHYLPSRTLSSHKVAGKPQLPIINVMFDSDSTKGPIAYIKASVRGKVV